MKIFYLCRTGRHTSLLAAALHLGLISAGDSRKGCSLPGYNEISNREVGKPYYVGEDTCGREIYTFGTGNENIIMARAANDLISLMGVASGGWKIIDINPFISKWTCLGLKTKRFHLKMLSKFFFHLGAKKELIRLSQSEEIINNKNYR